MLGLLKTKFLTAASNAIAPVLVLIEAMTVLFSAFGKLSTEVLASNFTVAEVVILFWANTPVPAIIKDKKRVALFISRFFFGFIYLFKVDLLKLIAVTSSIWL